MAVASHDDLDVLRPGDADFDAVRPIAGARFAAVRPTAIARCASAAQVATAIAYARSTDLPLALRSGGHCFAGRSTGPGVVIDVRPIHAVRVEGEYAIVGAGARLGEIYDALAAHGRTFVAGCGTQVGIAGLVLGGGLGLLGRTHGLACDQLVSAEVVLADGSVVTCDAERDADLLWALRGAGGGQFGVVTTLTLRTVPEPQATVFRLAWPIEQAAELLAAWQTWSPDGPDALAASVLVNADATGARATVIGAMLASREETAAALAQLPGEPSTRRLHFGPYRAGKAWLVAADEGGGDDGDHLHMRTRFFRDALPADAIAELVDGLVRDRPRAEVRELDISPWGGAYNRVQADATAFPHRAERFLVKHSIAIAPPARPSEWLARSWAALAKWGTSSAYVNFPDPELADPGAAYHGPNLPRLRAIKARYDPDEVFSFPQSIAPG
jgi:FAD/FMN-containing dehydrogenase